MTVAIGKGRVEEVAAALHGEVEGVLPAAAMHAERTAVAITPEELGAARWTYVLALALGGLSHLLVDACLDANASNGIGVAIGWPLRDAMWSPVIIASYD